jgi:hypothetical protein
MSRSGYVEDCDYEISWINWRGAVKSALRGKRGQAFLYEMLQAMAALPERKLVSGELEQEGAVCAIGAVGKARGIDMSKLDPEDYDTVAGTFGIARAMAQEIVYMNDEATYGETDEQRFDRMRQWIESELFDKSEPVTSGVRKSES